MSEDAGDSEFTKHTPKNVLSEAAYIVVSMCITLFLVPYYIGELGMAAYAIIPLATSVTSYVMIFSDAFCSAIIRYFILSLESGDDLDANRTYSTSMYGLMKMMVVVVPVMAAVAFFSPMLFDITGSTADSVRLLFLMVLLSTLVVAAGSCFNYTQLAVNKLHSINLARVCYLGSQVLIIFLLFLCFDPKLEHIGVAYLASSLIYAAISYVMMKRNFPQLRFSRKDSSRVRLGEITDLGTWSVVNKLSSLLFLQASLIVANVCLGTVAEGRLSLVVNIVMMVSSGCMTLTNIFNPYYYRSYSKSDMDGVAAMAVTSIRLTSVIIACPLAFICIFSSEVMTAWVGAEYSDLGPVIWAMLLLLVMQASVTSADTVTVLTLKVRDLALMSMAIGVLNIILGVILALYTDLGILGIAVSYGITMTLRSCVYYPRYVSGLMGKSTSVIIRPQLEGLALFLASAAVFYVLSMFVNMPASLMLIAVIFLVVFVIYLPLALRLTTNERDKEFIRVALPHAVSKFIRRVLLALPFQTL